MNILRKEIRKCMTTPVEKTEQGVVARFSFPKDFTGFKGHFPSEPIVPGVCKIQALIILSEFLNGEIFELKEIKEAKFFSPVFNSDEVVFEYSENIDNNKKAIIKARVLCKDRKIAKITLLGTFVSKEGG